jgi:hypothetical protein
MFAEQLGLDQVSAAGRGRTGKLTAASSEHMRSPPSASRFGATGSPSALSCAQVGRSADGASAARSAPAVHTATQDRQAPRPVRLVHGECKDPMHKASRRGFVQAHSRAASSLHTAW